MQSVEVERILDEDGLLDARGAQAEIPIVVVAVVAESAHCAEEFALHEQVAARDRDVELDQRKAVRLRADRLPLLLQDVDRKGRTLALGIRALDERESPPRPGARDRVDELRDARR